MHFLGSLCSSLGCYSIRHSGSDLQLHTASSVSVTGSHLAPGPGALTSIYRMLLICPPPPPPTGQFSVMGAALPLIEMSNRYVAM